ncbi:MAG: hypothetical protein WCB96_12925 [Candidatus Aminicenantales bacterium]
MENLRRAADPDSSGRLAGVRVDAHVPARASASLVLRPEPAHTPDFGYDRYGLVVFDRIAALKDSPEWIVVKEMDRFDIDSLLQ